MAITPPDLRQTVQYQPMGTRKRMLLIALALFAISFIALAFGDDGGPRLLAFLGVAVGLGWAGFEFFRLFNPGRPVLVLSSVGVDYRAPGGRPVFIPWTEIVEVTVADVKIRKRTFRNVTMLKVSESFFASEVEERLGALVATNRYLFIPSGNFVNVAVHHDVIGITPQALREAIGARWYQFHNREKADWPTVTLIPRTACGTAFQAP